MRCKESINNACYEASTTTEEYATAAPTPLTRRTVLETAIQTVCRDREDQYGEPENNFKTIADMWTAYLRAAGVIEQHSDGVVEPHDVAAMMCLLKLARIATGVSKTDNWVDLAGYAALGGEVEV